jgi:PHD/YefM family antitoxin component YafN of YafNO toxin-antitoxin module
MLKIKNIRSVTDFARNTREHIERLQSSGEPEVLTVNGKAAVVVQDAEAYQRILDQIDYADTVRILRERLASYKKDKRGRSFREVIREIAAEAGIDLTK